MQKITMASLNNLTIEQAFTLFERRCKVKNLSHQTLTYYQDTFSHFKKFIGEETNIATIDAHLIEDYTLHLKTLDIKDITVNTYIRGIRAYLYFCMDNGYLNRFKIVLMKVDKDIKPTYTDDELARLIDKPNIRQCSFAEYKTWVYINYLLGTGNRISTALNVRNRDIDFDNGVIFLRKLKNRKQQVIPLSNNLADILREYLEIRGGEDDDYLFCNDYGRQACPRVYQDLLTRYNINRNVMKTSSHLFRHTFAKNWIMAGGDIIRLQKVLGHSDLTVTKEYLNMFGEDLQVDFDKFNPLDRFLNSQKEERIVMRK